MDHDDDDDGCQEAFKFDALMNLTVSVRPAVRPALTQ